MMPAKVRLILAIVISLLPLNRLRVGGYRMLGYDIRDSRIGWGTIISVAGASVTSATIGPINLFVGPLTIDIRPGARIGNRNEFSCGSWVADVRYHDAAYGRALIIESGATVTCRHYFDVSGRLRIGERTLIAGLSSQFWTHGAGVADRDVSIGSDCYVGSVVRFAPGASVGNNVIVAMGSVVTGRIDGDDAMVGGVPAKVIKSGYDWRTASPNDEPGPDRASGQA